MFGVEILPVPMNIPFQFGNLILTHALTYAESINPEKKDAVIVKTILGVIDALGAFVACPLASPVVKILDQADYAVLLAGAPAGDYSISELKAAVDAKPDTAAVDIEPVVP